MLLTVKLTKDQWDFICNTLATKLTWIEANPFLIEISQQVEAQKLGAHNIAQANQPSANGGDHDLPAQS